MTTYNDKGEKDILPYEQGLTEAALAKVPNISISDIQQIADLVDSFKWGCDVSVTNETPYCWVPSSHYSAHGKFAAGMAKLPAIAPQYTDKVGETVVFSEAVAVTNLFLKAPTCVMIWEALDSDLYLIIYVDIWKSASNDGYFTLTTTYPGTAEEWYQNNDDIGIDYGSISKKCKTTVSGVTIDGTLSNDAKDGAMAITLTV